MLTGDGVLTGSTGDGMLPLSAIATGRGMLMDEATKLIALHWADWVVIILYGDVIQGLFIIILSFLMIPFAIAQAGGLAPLDSMMVGFSGMCVNNFYREHFVKNASAAHYLLVTRILAVAGVGLGWAVADIVESLVRFATIVEPLGEEKKLREGGFHEDDLEALDHEVITVDARDHDMSKRLLLPDIFRLPGLIRSGEAKLSDYKWDWYGLFGGIAFVILFLYGVNCLGKLF